MPKIPPYWSASSNNNLLSNMVLLKVKKKPICWCRLKKLLASANNHVQFVQKQAKMRQAQFLSL